MSRSTAPQCRSGGQQTRFQHFPTCTNSPSSGPALCRASTPPRHKQGVDGRDKPGLDEQSGSTLTGTVLAPRERQLPGVFLHHGVALILADAVDRRKLVLPGPGPHRVIDRARIDVRPVGGLLGRHARIERRRPAVLNDLDVWSPDRPAWSSAHTTSSMLEGSMSRPRSPRSGRCGPRPSRRARPCRPAWHARLLPLDRHHHQKHVVHIGAHDAGARRQPELPPGCRFEAHRMMRCAQPVAPCSGWDRCSRSPSPDDWCSSAVPLEPTVIAGPFAERTLQPRLHVGRRHLA